MKELTAPRTKLNVGMIAAFGSVVFAAKDATAAAVSLRYNSVVVMSPP